jgi:hypothetical protein
MVRAATHPCEVVISHRQRDRQTERQTDRERERQTDRQTEKETDRQRDRETERQTEKETQAGRQAGRQAVCSLRSASETAISTGKLSYRTQGGFSCDGLGDLGGGGASSPMIAHVGPCDIR